MEALVADGQTGAQRPSSSLSRLSDSLVRRRRPLSGSHSRTSSPGTGAAVAAAGGGVEIRTALPLIPSTASTPSSATAAPAAAPTTAATTGGEYGLLSTTKTESTTTGVSAVVADAVARAVGRPPAEEEEEARPHNAPSSCGEWEELGDADEVPPVHPAPAYPTEDDVTATATSLPGRPPLSRPPPTTAPPEPAVEDSWRELSTPSLREGGAVRTHSITQAQDADPNELSQALESSLPADAHASNHSSTRSPRSSPVKPSLFPSRSPADKPARRLRMVMETQVPAQAKPITTVLPAAVRAREQRLASIHGEESEPAELAMPNVTAARQREMPIAASRSPPEKDLAPSGTIAQRPPRGAKARRAMMRAGSLVSATSSVAPDEEVRRKSVVHVYRYGTKPAQPQPLLVAEEEEEEEEEVEEEEDPVAAAAAVAATAPNGQASEAKNHDAAQPSPAPIRRVLAEELSAPRLPVSAETMRRESHHISTAAEHDAADHHTGLPLYAELAQPHTDMYPAETIEELDELAQTHDSAVQSYVARQRRASHALASPSDADSPRRRHSAYPTEPETNNHEHSHSAVSATATPLSAREDHPAPDTHPVLAVQAREQYIGQPRPSLFVDHEGAGDGAPRGTLITDVLRAPAVAEFPDTAHDAPTTQVHPAQAEVQRRESHHVSFTPTQELRRHSAYPTEADAANAPRAVETVRHDSHCLPNQQADDSDHRRYSAYPTEADAANAPRAVETVRHDSHCLPNQQADDSDHRRYSAYPTEQAMPGKRRRLPQVTAGESEDPMRHSLASDIEDYEEEEEEEPGAISTSDAGPRHPEIQQRTSRHVFVETTESRLAPYSSAQLMEQEHDRVTPRKAEVTGWEVESHKRQEEVVQRVPLAPNRPSSAVGESAVSPWYHTRTVRRPFYPHRDRATQTTDTDTAEARRAEEVDWASTHSATTGTAVADGGYRSPKKEETRRRPSTSPARRPPKSSAASASTNTKLPPVRGPYAATAAVPQPRRTASTRPTTSRTTSTALAPLSATRSSAQATASSCYYCAGSRNEFSSALAAKRALQLQQARGQPHTEPDKPRHRHIAARRMAPLGTADDHAYRYCDLETGAMMAHQPGRRRRPQGKDVYLRAYNDGI